MLTARQLALVLHAVALIGALLVLVPRLTALDGPAGYLLALVFYWLAFCIPVIAIHALARPEPLLFSERLPWRDWWIPLLLLLQVIAVIVLAFAPNTAMLTTHGAMLAGAIALIHAPLEETAWRGGFMATFRDRPGLGFGLGWLLFSAAHIPFAISLNLVLPGGWPAIVGEAALLGLLWSWIAWRTGSVFWVVIANGLTNALTFWLLFDANGFVAPQP